jgi:hypothetical protein
MFRRHGGVFMLHVPAFELEDGEADLLDNAPELLLRRAVARNAVSLDRIAADLPPRSAAAVRAIATGERSALLEVDDVPFLEEPTLFEFGVAAEDDRPASDESESDDQGPRDAAGWTKQTLSQPYPQLLELIDQDALSPDEALQAAHQIDGLLGRYLTGTRYAAP